MGKLTRGHLIEAAIWLGFAVFAFIFSFQFDQSIEIYRYGAASWPRAVILIMVLAALGQLYWHWRYGDAGSGTSIGGSSHQDEVQADGESRLHYFIRVGGILGLPIIYAYFMSDIGFYASTPFFIAAVMFLMGERRPQYLIGITLLAYVLIVVIFAKWLYVGLPVGNVSPFYEFSNQLLVLLRGN